MTPLESETIALARSYVSKIKETGPNIAPGTDLEKIQAFCGAHPGDPWCSCYVSWCILKAAVTVPPTFRRSAGALRLLARNPNLVVPANEARRLLGEGHPLVFVLDTGAPGGAGHTGFALSLLPGDLLHTCEGNTGPGPATPAQDRDGGGCFERRDRKFGNVDGWLRIA